MSPPQQTSVTVAPPTLPSSSAAHASPPVTTTAPSFPMPIVTTLPSPATEAMTTEAELKLPTPVMKTVAAAPSVEVVAPVVGSGLTESLTITVEQKLTPVAATPAPVTASPVPKGSAFSAIVLTMAVNVRKMMWLNMLMMAAATLLVQVLVYLPEATSPKIMDTIVFSSFCSMRFFISSSYASCCLVMLTLLGIHQNSIAFRFITMLWAVAFLFGFCLLFTACYLMSIADAA